MTAAAPEPARTPPVRKDSGAASPYGDLAVLAGSVGLLALTFARIPRLPEQPEVWTAAQFIGGFLLCPLLILTVIQRGYLFARRQHWTGRRKSEAEQVRDVQIPPEARRPETFDGVGSIDAAQKKALAPVPDSQGRFRARALTTYAAPAVAVLLAGLHLTFWPRGPFGAGLVAGQALLVFFVFLRVVIDRRPAREWIERRTRGELFRREQYLCLARVGPYAEGRLTSPETRIAEIGAASFERMNELLAMEHEDDQDRATWLEHLSSRPARAPVFDDLLERVTSYQYYRTGKQIAWMRSAVADAENTARRIEWLVGIAAVCTVLVAGVSSVLLLAQPAAGQTAGSVTFLRAAVALGVFLPALGGMLLALQSVFNLRFLSANYQATERFLERLRKELIELQEEVARTWAGADAPGRRQLETRFQKLVLRVEAELTEEYVRWRMVTERDAHELV